MSAKSFVRLLILIFALCGAATFACAQSDADASERIPGTRQREEPSKGVQETLAKQRIEREKKDFAELLERGNEALKLSGELETSYEKTNNLTADDLKKLDRLEKVVKKIRNELGAESGDGDDEAESKSMSVSNALKTLRDDTAKLVDELKKTSRYSVSVVAVESSTALLSIVRFLRLRKN